MKRYLTVGIIFGLLLAIVVAISWFLIPGWQSPTSRKNESHVVQAVLILLGEIRVVFDENGFFYTTHIDLTLIETIDRRVGLSFS